MLTRLLTYSRILAGHLKTPAQENILLGERRFTLVYRAYEKAAGPFFVVLLRCQCFGQIRATQRARLAAVCGGAATSRAARFVALRAGRAASAVLRNWARAPPAPTLAPSLYGRVKTQVCSSSDTLPDGPSCFGQLRWRRKRKLATARQAPPPTRFVSARLQCAQHSCAAARRRQPRTQMPVETTSAGRRRAHERRSSAWLRASRRRRLEPARKGLAAR
jgi:hypothetical protein